MGNAKHSFGTTIAKGVTTIAEITEINGVDLTADAIDVTTLSSANGYREFIQGLRDGGEISMSGFFYPGDTGQSGLLTDFNDGSLDEYVITFPTAMGATWTFNAIVTGYKTGASVDGAVTFEATLKISGKPTLGTTASTGASAIVLTGTGGSMSPAFNIAKYVYTHTFNTSTSITITVTAASHTIKLYIDGVYTETLSSGSASAAISFAAAQGKLIQAVVYESGKTPKTYTIAAVRTA